MNSIPRDRYLTPSDFQQTCGFCGCVFRVEITWRTSYSPKVNQDTQAYSCPECRRDSRVRTSTEPQLTLISKRTDGRTGPCPSHWKETVAAGRPEPAAPAPGRRSGAKSP